jgi:hypothetical protein
MSHHLFLKRYLRNIDVWWALRDLNPRPSPCKGDALVDPRKIETYIYVYGGELADPGARLRQAVLNVTPRPIAMGSLN